MIHCTLTQNKLRVEQDTDVLPFQYSNNINIQFIKDSAYENYVVTPYYAWVPTRSIPPRKLEAFALPLKDGIFTLPMSAFIKDGYLGIAFSLTDGNEVLQTDPVYLAVQSSVGSNNILPESDSWQLVVIDTVNSYIELNVNDKLQALIKEVAKLDENSTELQREVNELIDKVNKMLEDGDFIPEHKWENTFLHFKNPDGSWDNGVNLKGPSGVYFGNDTPPEDGEYNVWVLPDGTPDFEIYADQVKTQDGSNVQQKISNSFNLGSDRDGVPHIQNENGRVWLNKTDLNSAVYTGMYYCTETLNRPNNKDGYLQVIATNDNYAMQRFTDNDNIPRTFERVMSNGAWSSWVELSSLIETGAANGLRYYKYSDGRLTYIVNATTQATITSAHGSVYISGLRSMDSYKYPVGFSSIPTVTATVGANGDNVLVWIAVGDNITAYDAPPDFYICKGTSDSTSRSYRVGMVVEGRWR